MKKILFLVFVLVFMCACEAEYTLKIENGVFRESLDVINTAVNTWEDNSYRDRVLNYLEASIPSDYRHAAANHEDNERIEGIDYYDIKVNQEMRNLGVSFNHSFSIEKYIHSNIVSTHFKDANIEYIFDNISIKSGKITEAFEIMYPGLNKLTVRILTNHRIVESNADEVKNKIHYWYFNTNNYANKEIRFLINNEADDKLKLPSVQENKGNKTIIFVSLATVVFVFCFAGLFIYVKVKNSNR